MNKMYEMNILEYFIIALPAIIAILKISFIEWCFIIFAIGFVFVAELINTAIEVFIDYICPSYNVSAGRSKDLAAAAVFFPIRGTG